MDPQTTRKLTHRSSADLEASNNAWQTPPPVFAKLQRDFGPFTIDLTADSTNHLLDDWIGPDHPEPGYRDVLAVLPRAQHHRGYSNPVYHWRFLAQYIPLLARAAADRDVASTLLLPLRTTGAWWQHLLANAYDSRYGAAGIYFCDRRICFYENGHPRWNEKELARGRYSPDAAVFDSVIVHFEAGNARQTLDTHWNLWEVPPHVPKPEVITL